MLQAKHYKKKNGQAPYHKYNYKRKYIIYLQKRHFLTHAGTRSQSCVDIQAHLPTCGPKYLKVKKKNKEELKSPLYYTKKHVITAIHGFWMVTTQ